MKTFLWTLLAVTVVVAGACADEDGTDVSTETPAMTRSPATSPSPEGSPSPSPQTPAAELARCENPTGFAIEYPQDWHTNPGEVVPPCSQFNPRPFEVPRGTDERVAAITAYVDPVPFERAADATGRNEVEREELTIAGRRSLRLEYRSGGDALWPEGTPVTIYLVDLPASGEGGERTLFIDTIGLEPFDYERNQEVLDRIAPELELTA